MFLGLPSDKVYGERAHVTHSRPTVVLDEREPRRK